MSGGDNSRAAIRSGAPALNLTLHPRRSMSFTARFALALGAGLVAAVIVAPIAAVAVARAGWRFPFPRIFDRTVMATLFFAMLFIARDLNLGALLRSGFIHPAKESTLRALRGLAVSFCTIAILFALAITIGRGATTDVGSFASRVPGYILSAIAIAIIEEGFFRAFLLGGMRTDFGNLGALTASSAFYALAHLVRSPAHFYVTSYEPAAGLATLAHSMDQLSHLATAIPTLIGLLLLGIVLGKAYLLTGSVYFSIGLHAGFVLGAKLWPKIILNRAAIPWWLAGPGPVPLIAAPAAWALAIIILISLRPLTGAQRSTAS
jgi:membrane protease YdiL (CAAX protease family)